MKSFTLILASLPAFAQIPGLAIHQGSYSPCPGATGPQILLWIGGSPTNNCVPVKIGVNGVLTAQMPATSIYPNTPLGNAAAVILGPALASGSNPWPYADALHSQAATYFAGMQSPNCTPIPGGAVQPDQCFVPWWNTASPGTVSSPQQNGNVWTFTGVNTQALFCGNGTSPVGNNSNSNPSGFTPWYTIAGMSSRFPATVTGCPTATTVTTYEAWPYPAQAAPMNFTAYDSVQAGNIDGQSNSENYYGNIDAFYSAHFRTPGDTAYLKAAESLAQTWWTSPYIDRGQRAISGDGQVMLAPRQTDLNGLIFYAADGHPEMWPGIEAMVAYYGGTPGKAWGWAMGPGVVGDGREVGYAMQAQALVAQFDPNATAAAAARAAYDFNVLNVLLPATVTSGPNKGVWQTASLGYATWNSTIGTAQVTNGSTLVTVSSPIPASVFPGAWFYACNLPAGVSPTSNAQCDSTAYVPTQVDATHFTLDRPYQGATRLLTGWQINLEVGVGTLPYQMGMIARALEYGLDMADANSPLLLTMQAAVATYWQTQAFNPQTNGFFYGTGFGSCNALGHGNLDCNEGMTGIEPSRALVPEAIGALALIYARAPTVALRGFIDTLYSAMFSGPANGCQTGPLSGPTGAGFISDGNYIAELLQVQLSNATCNYTWAVWAKWFGFYFGAGGSQIWAAVRTITPVS